MNISFSQSNSIQKTDNLRWEEAANLETAVKPHVTFTVYGLLNCFNTNTFAIHRKTMSWVKGCFFYSDKGIPRYTECRPGAKTSIPKN